MAAIRSEAVDRVIRAAEDEARTLHHDHIGTEHLLLGVLSLGDEVGAQALGRVGVSLADARARVMRIVGLPDEASPPQLPVTPPARDALGNALREAIELGRTTVGAEHVLLGLLRERDGIAVRVLHDAGVDARRLREAVRALSDEKAALVAASGASAAAVRRTGDEAIMGAYALRGVLAAGGPAADLLRSRGIDETAIARLLQGAR